ncbi:MAG: hypothetical protein KDD53_07035, partial [Bdellovibrionales bacterium]|nr:hypothetical protein [Bdellovibrionales bacterium]
YIFVELARDRQNRSAISVLAIAIISFLFAISLLTFNLDLAHHLRPVFQTMIVSVGFLIAQSLVHQILLIRRSGETGAVSIRLHQLTLMKDIFTLIFAIVMGVSSGWPVIFCAGFAIIFKALLLWQFRWTRVSPLAAERRGINYPAPQY